MEKKRIRDLILISFLFAVLIWTASGTVDFNSVGSKVNISGGEANNSFSNGVVNGSTWTRGARTEIINFTLNFTGADSVSRVNISIPSGYILMNLDTRNVTVSLNGGGQGGVGANWTFTNTSGVLSLLTVEGNHSSQGNNSLSIEFNVTATDGVEGAYTWNVSFTDNVTANTDIESTTFITYVDGLRPRLTELNVTDGITTLKASSEELNSTKFLKNASITVYATLTDANFDEGARPRLFYSTNGQAANISSTGIVMSSSNLTGYTYRLNATIPVSQLLGNQTIPLAFIIQVNDSYNHMYIYNTSAQGGFNFSIDSVNPSVTVTPPSTTTIDTSASITYTCAGSDTDGSGVASYLWTLTKPNSQTKTATTASVTFTGVDTQVAGTYSLTCKVTDVVGYETTSTVYQFTAHLTSSSSSSSGGSSSSGSGSSGTTADVKVDHNLAKETDATVEVAKKEGQSTTISLDSKTSHKVSFKKVTASSVTLLIESDPVEVTLSVGESKQVDLDGDGTNELEVSLESISGGAAKISMKKIAQTAVEKTTPTTPTTETTPETTPGETTPTTGGEAVEGSSSLTWLWVLIIVVIVVAIVAVIMKKKKK